MPNPRDVLNELKWKQGFDLDKAEIWYIHRGAPNDTKIILGKDIVALEKSFMRTTDAMIPYHRIFKIVYDQKIIFER
ncbi:MAG: RNA repair domain-containing protein [Euryarchaeota archaeon]|nr:RNA repair domain-containing protein [Euryarchaeota archaeon]